MRQLFQVVVLLYGAIGLSYCVTQGSGDASSTLSDAGTEQQFAQPPADTIVPGRWSEARAKAYFGAHDIPLGANYNPRSTINQLEFWQAETFPLAEVREELGWAAELGMNSMRVYLHDLVWSADSTAFLDRVDQYLAVADSLGISTTLVLFDAVWNPQAATGTQPAPKPHLHNSGWVQSPTEEMLTADRRNFPVFERYVKSVIRRFRQDERVYMWDLYNEPDNDNFNKFPAEDVATKSDRVFPLMVATFGWARSLAPMQPLTAGVWTNDLTNDDSLGRYNQYQLNNSDLITFHYYGVPSEATPYLNLSRYGRPLICTEYVARSYGNDFLTMLPVWVENEVGAYNWGLVDGKSQTKYPWFSWDSLYTTEPKLWHHEVLHADGSPYREAEAEQLRLAGKAYQKN